MKKFSVASLLRALQHLWMCRFSGRSVSSCPGTTRGPGPGPGPRCTLQRPPWGQPPAELSSCAVLRAGPCQGVPGLRGALSRHGPFCYGPSVVPLPFLALRAVVLARWPLVLASLSSRASSKRLSRDGPQPGASWAVSGLCWLSPSEAEAAGPGYAAREPEIGHLVSGLHRNLGTVAVVPGKPAGSQLLQGHGPPTAQHFTVAHPTRPSWRPAGGGASNVVSIFQPALFPEASPTASQPLLLCVLHAAPSGPSRGRWRLLLSF